MFDKRPPSQKLFSYQRIPFVTHAASDTYSEKDNDSDSKVTNSETKTIFVSNSGQLYRMYMIILCSNVKCQMSNVFVPSVVEEQIPWFVFVPLIV